MPDAPSSEWQVYAGFLPEGPPDKDTEFAFIEGVAFVNATKHEEVVARHCAVRDRYRKALEEIADHAQFWDDDDRRARLEIAQTARAAISSLRPSTEDS